MTDISNRPKLRAFTDILAILAELPTLEDANEVVYALANFVSPHNCRVQLASLWWPNELPATTRLNLAQAAVGDDE